MACAALALLATSAPAAAVSPVVVSEVQGASGAGELHEWVELANRSEADVVIGGAELLFRGESCELVHGGDAVRVVIPSGTLLAPGQRYLVASSEWPGPPSADLVMPGSGLDRMDLDGFGGGVELAGHDDAFRDALAWGQYSFACAESESPEQEIAQNGQSLERAGAGLQDTDDNNADFGVRNPSDPQSSTAGDFDGDGVSGDADKCPQQNGRPEDGCAVQHGSADRDPDQPPPVAETSPLSLLEITLSPFPPAGAPAGLTVRGSVPGGQFNGGWAADAVALDPVGLSACQLEPKAGTEFAAGAVNHVQLPLDFVPGAQQDLQIHTVSGGCGGTPREIGRVQTVPAAPGSAAAARQPQARTSARGCGGSRSALTERSARRWARALRCELNAARRAAGLKPLRTSRRLARAAGAHALDMVRLGYFTHDGPVTGSLRSRLGKMRYRQPAGENLSLGIRTPSGLARAYQESPGHRRNLLMRAYRWVGIGAYEANPVGRRRPGATVSVIFGTRQR